MLACYAGFTGATLLCAAAPEYYSLVLARGLAGAFGGVLSGVVHAIVSDAFPPQRRGLALGVVMSSFSLASIVGVPLGLLGVSTWGWRLPFWALGLLSGLMLVSARVVLPAQRHHLQAQHGPPTPLVSVLRDPNHLRAFGFMTMLVLASMIVVPFIPAYLVANVGIAAEQLGYLYLAGGVGTLSTLTLVGWLSDRFGKLAIFRICAILTAIGCLLLTHLPPLSLTPVLAVFTYVMVVNSARMVPAMALITASARRHLRGSFLTVNGSVQQTAMGLASLLAGFLVTRGEGGKELVGFGTAGVLGALASLATISMAGLLRPASDARDGLATVETPVLAEL